MVIVTAQVFCVKKAMNFDAVLVDNELMSSLAESTDDSDENGRV